MKATRAISRQIPRIASSRLISPAPSFFQPRPLVIAANGSHTQTFLPLLSRSYQVSALRLNAQKEDTQSSQASNQPSRAQPPPSSQQPFLKPPDPAYELTFTCKPCKVRSSHRISKQGYHKGTIVISCPSCHNRHIISDHLGIFMDQASDLEDIMKRHGGLVKKGTLGFKDGQDVEFWEDGTETVRERKGEEKTKGQAQLENPIS
ncbi:MAG: hypothetical protein Q9227_002348 [Pyrenula ochraceoflavens]